MQYLFLRLSKMRDEIPIRRTRHVAETRSNGGPIADAVFAHRQGFWLA